MASKTSWFVPVAVAAAAALALFAKGQGPELRQIWKWSYDRGGMAVSSMYGETEVEVRAMARKVQNALSNVNLLGRPKLVNGYLEQVRKSRELIDRL